MLSSSRTVSGDTKVSWEIKRKRNKRTRIGVVPDEVTEMEKVTVAKTLDRELRLHRVHRGAVVSTTSGDHPVPSYFTDYHKPHSSSLTRHEKTRHADLSGRPGKRLWFVTDIEHRLVVVEERSEQDKTAGQRCE